MEPTEDRVRNDVEALSSIFFRCFYQCRRL